MSKKMPKHWKKVKKALNEAMKIEMGLDKDDDRDCIYFSLDSTIAHMMAYLMPEFIKYSKKYTETWGNMTHDETFKIMRDMNKWFQAYIKDDFDTQWKSTEEYEEFKKRTFGKFYEHFEGLWT